MPSSSSASAACTDVLATVAKAFLIAAPKLMLDGLYDGVGNLRDLTPDRSHFRVGSICSGSGMSDVALATLLKVFGREILVSSANVKVAFMCECNSQKVEFLRRNLDPPLVFGDARQMGCPSAFDKLSQSYQKVPPCEILSAGFSCKDLSRLNKNRGMLRQIIMKYVRLQKMPDGEDDIGTTTQTLLGVLLYVDVHRPAVLLLENVNEFVQNLDGEGSLYDLVKDILWTKGYVAVLIQTSPEMMGMPTRRARPYAIFYHSLQLWQTPGTLMREQQLVDEMESGWKFLSSVAHKFSLKDMLFTEGSLELQRRLKELAPSKFLGDDEDILI